jgi:hypothetical protein
VNNLLINEANPESNESVVSQHSGIFFRMRKGSIAAKAGYVNINETLFL